MGFLKKIRGDGIRGGAVLMMKMIVTKETEDPLFAPPQIDDDSRPTSKPEPPQERTSEPQSTYI